MRLSQDIAISTREFNSTLIGQGWDTIKETYNLLLSDQKKEVLNSLKVDFQDKNTGKGKRQGFTIVFGNMEFQLDPWGVKGTPYVLKNDLFTIDIRYMGEWDVSVTYSAACLWQYGYAEAQRMLLEVLLSEMRPLCTDGEGIEAWQRISVAHYALDFYSPDLTQDFGFHFPEQFICHSSSKVRVDFEQKGYVMGNSVKCQTFTVGSKAGLQIQLYDKITEIKEASGKTWMYKIWEQEGFHPTEEQKKDVWRLEIRMGKAFLRGNSGRSVETPEQLLENICPLLSEALKTRRLVEPDGSEDKNKRKWPMHPFWGHAWREVGSCKEMLPIGKQVEEVGEVIQQRLKQDLKSIIRRDCSINVGDFDHDRAKALWFEVMQEIEHDDDHELKMEIYNERYKFINCPK